MSNPITWRRELPSVVRSDSRKVQAVEPIIGTTFNAAQLAAIKRLIRNPIVAREESGS